MDILNKIAALLYEDMGAGIDRHGSDYQALVHEECMASEKLNALVGEDLMAEFYNASAKREEYALLISFLYGVRVGACAGAEKPFAE